MLTQIASERKKEEKWKKIRKILDNTKLGYTRQEPRKNRDTRDKKKPVCSL
jgi:hypothetical protein